MVYEDDDDGETDIKNEISKQARLQREEKLWKGNKNHKKTVKKPPKMSTLRNVWLRFFDLTETLVN